MRRMIVSGAGGFLGSHIISKARKIGIACVAITKKKELLSQGAGISAEEFLQNGYLCRSDDVFVNCFFPTNADGLHMAEGLEKVYKIITKAHECGVGAFINVSSQSVYPSKRTVPACEQDRLSLETPYAVGKYSSEAFVNHVFSDRPHTNIRMASLLGVGYDQRIVNRMIIQAFNGIRQMNIMGGMQRYGFLDVRDAASGLVKLAMSDAAAWNEIYNLGRNESYTLIEVAECIAAEMKREVNMDVGYCITEGQDNRNSALDASLFMHTFDWKPEITLSETVAAIIRSKKDEAN